MILRGTLFRKYVVYFVTLVTVALIASGGIGVYFTYKESKAALLDLQREKALAPPRVSKPMCRKSSIRSAGCGCRRSARPIPSSAASIT